MTAPVAVGIGCREGCPADDIVSLVREALGRLGTPAPAGLFSVVEKRGEPGLFEAATALGLPLVFFERAALARVAGKVDTRSPRVAALFGLPGIAETAALAGAGDGSVLLVPRLAGPRATCAIAGAARA